MGLPFFGDGMNHTLSVTIGQYSDRGRKPTNQDFHGALIPEPPLLHMKGLVVALADGISSSTVSAIAAETAVKSLLTDYFCTADSWPVRMAMQRVIAATNSWLHAQGQAAPTRTSRTWAMCVRSAPWCSRVAPPTSSMSGTRALAASWAVHWNR